MGDLFHDDSIMDDIRQSVGLPSIADVARARRRRPADEWSVHRDLAAEQRILADIESAISDMASVTAIPLWTYNPAGPAIATTTSDPDGTVVHTITTLPAR